MKDNEFDRENIHYVANVFQSGISLDFGVENIALLRVVLKQLGDIRHLILQMIGLGFHVGMGLLPFLIEFILEVHKSRLNLIIDLSLKL